MSNFLEELELKFIGTPIQGPSGESAYELAVANGYVGTVADWLDSLEAKDIEMGLTLTHIVWRRVGDAVWQNLLALSEIQTEMRRNGDDIEWRIGDGEWVVLYNISTLKGDKGDVGAMPVIAIGTVTTGPAGSNASVTLGGTTANPTLNFVIPRGNQGIQGIQGLSGRITSATADTGAAGTQVQLALGGTPEERTMAFTIPRGNTGAAGQHALVGAISHESHVFPASNAGVVSSFVGSGGTFKVFLGQTDVSSACTFTNLGGQNLTASINSVGIYTISAISADTGYVDFQAEFQGAQLVRRYNASKSRAGADGTNGAKGDSPVFTVAGTSTGNAGSNASVTVNNTNPLAPALSFIIPRGNAGTNGTNGTDGTNGFNGWTPQFAMISDGNRRVLQVSGWVGGQGATPAIGQYVGPAGLVSTVGAAIDLRGPAGQAGDGAGDMRSENNLDDVDSKPNARNNLSVYSKAEITALNAALSASIDGKAVPADITTAIGNYDNTLKGGALPVALDTLFKMTGRLTSNTAAIGDRALNSDLATLSGVVGGKAEQATVTALSNNLSALAGVVATKASQSDLDSLDALVDTKASQASVDANAATIASKASQDDMTALTGVVSGKASQASVDAITAVIRKTTNYTAVNKDTIKADTTGGVITITLPAAPVNDSKVVIFDPAGTWAANNVTVALGSKTLLGNTGSTFVLDLSGEFTFLFDTTKDSWTVSYKKVAA